MALTFPKLAIVALSAASVLAGCGGDSDDPPPTSETSSDTISDNDEGRVLTVGELVFANDTETARTAALHACLCDRYGTPSDKPFIKSPSNGVGVEWESADEFHEVETSTYGLPDVEGVAVSAFVPASTADGDRMVRVGLSQSIITTGDAVGVSLWPAGTERDSNGRIAGTPLLSVGDRGYLVALERSELRDVATREPIRNISVRADEDAWPALVRMRSSPDELTALAQETLRELEREVTANFDTRPMEKCVALGESEGGGAPGCEQYEPVSSEELDVLRADLATYVSEEQEKITLHAAALHEGLVAAFPDGCLTA